MQSNKVFPPKLPAAAFDLVGCRRTEANSPLAKAFEEYQESPHYKLSLLKLVIPDEEERRDVIWGIFTKAFLAAYPDGWKASV